KRNFAAPESGIVPTAHSRCARLSDVLCGRSGEGAAGGLLLPRPSKKPHLGSPTAAKVGLSLERRLARRSEGGLACLDSANLRPSWSSAAGPLRLGVLLPRPAVQPRGRTCLRSREDGKGYPAATPSKMRQTQLRL